MLESGPPLDTPSHQDPDLVPRTDYAFPGELIPSKKVSHADAVP